jgi:hypothetical protein
MDIRVISGTSSPAFNNISGAENTDCQNNAQQYSSVSFNSFAVNISEAICYCLLVVSKSGGKNWTVI